jgi:hypothetical protein
MTVGQGKTVLGMNLTNRGTQHTEKDDTGDDCEHDVQWITSKNTEKPMADVRGKLP